MLPSSSAVRIMFAYSGTRSIHTALLLFSFTVRIVGAFLTLNARSCSGASWVLGGAARDASALCHRSSGSGGAAANTFHHNLD